MAKSARKIAVETVTTGVNVALLKQIKSGEVTRVTKDEGDPLLAHNPPLIDVNLNDIVDDKALVRLTNEGEQMIASENTATAPVSNGASHRFEVITNAVLPPRKRLGRAPGATKYPFDELQVGGSFFVPKGPEHPNPVKSLASTISNANMKYAEKTGEKKEKERVKRGPGNKAMIDEQGNKIMEKVLVDEYRPTRKFSMRGVNAGQQCGDWVAPADGVLISRIM